MIYLLDTDHVSFLQRRVGPEYAVLAAKMAQHSPADFAFSIVSFHEQVLGANAFINQAKTTADTTRGYTLLQEILTGICRRPGHGLRRPGRRGVRRLAGAARPHRHDGFANRLNCPLPWVNPANSQRQ
jgi:hypothetical protein